MRILVIGGTGMLGHKLWQAYRERFETWVTVRSGFHEYESYGLFDSKHMVGGVDVFDFGTVERAFAVVRPDAVINCIGIIKQLPSAQDPIISLTVNSLFPHRLAALCQAVGARLIHISTDCVFSGHKGMYRETDIPDAEDLYGRTKLLGEVSGPGVLTLRTSIIGRELKTANGLVEWFLSHREGPVRGFTQAIYSGITTQSFAKIIADVLLSYPLLTGLYQVSSDPISKYNLLCLLRDMFGRQIEIEPCPDPQINRSLDSSRFRGATGFVPLPWAEMVETMASDSTPYDEWRNQDGS